MTNQDIISKIETIVTSYTQRTEGLSEFDESTNFLNDLEINSANLVDVVLDVEDEFDIEIDNESMEGMMTVGDARDIIVKKLGD